MRPLQAAQEPAAAFPDGLLNCDVHFGQGTYARLPSEHDCSLQSEAHAARVHVWRHRLEPLTTRAISCQRITMYARRVFRLWGMRDEPLPAPKPLEESVDINECEQALASVERRAASLVLEGETLWLQDDGSYSSNRTLHPRTHWYRGAETFNATIYLVLIGHVHAFSAKEFHISVESGHKCTQLDDGYCLTRNQTLVWNSTAIKSFNNPYTDDGEYNATLIGDALLINGIQHYFVLREKASQLLPEVSRSLRCAALRFFQRRLRFARSETKSAL